MSGATRSPRLVGSSSPNAPKVVTSDLVKRMAFRANGLISPAPTITHNAATQYAAGAANQFQPPSSSVFRISGPAQLGTTFGTNVDINPLWISPLAGQRSTWHGAMLIAFDFDGQAFEFRQRGAAANGGPGFRLWANEKAHAATVEVGNTASAAPSAGDFVKVDFGTAAYRRIVIEIIGNEVTGGFFYGCSASIKDTFYPPSIKTAKLFHVGDSFGQAGSTNSDDQGTGFVFNYARLLGIADINNGTSVTTTGPYHQSGSYPSYLQRITEDVIPANPDIVVVQGSINDANDYPAQSAGITAAVQAILSALKAGLPNAVIVMTSPMIARAPTAAQISVGGLYKAVCDSMGVPYIDALGQYAPFWFNGSGNFSVAANDGNADKYCNTDNVHPWQAGHDQLARLMARALAPHINVPVASGTVVSLPDVQTFTAGGTWTKPPGAKVVEVVVMGGGAGGGSGRRGASGTVRCGGGGGGSAGVHRTVIPADSLPATVAVGVGAGGAGGAARTTDDTDGATGSNGGTSTFGTYARSSAAGGGGAGTSSAGAAGSGGTPGGSVGGAASGTGGAGASGISNVTASPAGGGAGGGISAANAAAAGGNGGLPQQGDGLFSTGGVVDGAAPGVGGSQPVNSGGLGGGGAGGAASITTAAQAGATGGRYGGGGGGGGASLNLNNSGAGGAGFGGIVVVTSY